MIDPPQKLDIAIGQIAHQISSLVQARFGIRVQRMHDEFLCGKLRQFEIATRKAVATDWQLPCNTVGDWYMLLVQEAHYRDAYQPLIRYPSTTNPNFHCRIS